MSTLLGGFVSCLAQVQLEIMRVITKLTIANLAGEMLRGRRGTADITGHLLFRGWQCFARSAGWLGMHTDSERDTTVLRNSLGKCVEILAHFRSSDHMRRHLPRAPSDGESRNLTESVSKLLCRPSGTRLCSTLVPGTDVPGFPVSPLRGWNNSAVYSFAALGITTQTLTAPIVCRYSYNVRTSGSEVCLRLL